MENWYYMLKYDEDKRKNLTFCWRTKKQAVTQMAW